MEEIELILNNYVSNAELKSHTNKFNEQMRSGNINADTKFQYALILTRSRFSADHHRSIHILEDLSQTGDPDSYRDYLYYLVIANIKIKDYDRALQCVNKFIGVEPKNRQAALLKEYIEKKRYEYGAKNLGYLGLAAAAASAIIFAAVKLSNK